MKLLPTFFLELVPTPITTFQAPSNDRLLSLGDHDSQIAVTPWRDAFEGASDSALSLGQAFVHHEPGNLQPEPLRQFFDAHGEPLKLKARDFHD